MMQNFVSVLGNADGEYIAFCECDDYWIDENKLCKQLKLLGQHPDASFCFTDIRILKSETGDFEKNWATILKDKYNLEDIINNNVMSNCTVLMKNNIDTVMLNRVINFQVGDWPLYILSMYKSNTNAIYLNKVTTIYRHHMGGFHSTKNTIQRLQITNDVYKRLLRIVESRRILRCLNRQLAKNFYSMGVFQTNRTLAVENYRLSIKQISPSNLKFPLLSTVRVFQTFFFTNRIFNGKRNSFGECFNDSI